MQFSLLIREYEFNRALFGIAGFDIRKKEGYEQMMEEFERIVGLKYLKAIHMNDSLGMNFFENERS